MTIKLSTGLRTKMLNGGATGGIKGALDGGNINIYSGPQPLSADTGATGTLLATVSVAGAGLTFDAAVAGAISKAAAETLKRVTLELGGKGANVIFADADDRPVERGVRHMMDNTGQSCNAPSRMLVERPIYDRAVQIAAQAADSIKVGLAGEEGDHIGPVVNKRQWEQIQGYIQKGISEGARLVAGGPRSSACARSTRRSPLARRALPRKSASCSPVSRKSSPASSAASRRWAARRTSSS